MGIGNFGILEVVELAVNMEEEGIKFYGLAEERSDDPELRRTFALLKEKEYAHITIFRGLYSDLARRRGETEADLWTLDPTTEAYFRSYVEASVFPVQGAAEAVINGAGSPAEVLRLGMQAEKDSILFYHELLDHAPYPEAEDLLMQVIAEERGHLTLLHDLYRRMIEKST